MVLLYVFIHLSCFWPWWLIINNNKEAHFIFNGRWLHPSSAFKHLKGLSLFSILNFLIFKYTTDFKYHSFSTFKPDVWSKGWTSDNLTENLQPLKWLPALCLTMVRCRNYVSAALKSITYIVNKQKKKKYLRSWMCTCKTFSPTSFFTGTGTGRSLRCSIWTGIGNSCKELKKSFRTPLSSPSLSDFPFDFMWSCVDFSRVYFLWAELSSTFLICLWKLFPSVDFPWTKQFRDIKQIHDMNAKHFLR